MAEYLPGLNEHTVHRWTQTQLYTYLAVTYLDILIFGLLVLLALRNTWVIVLRQKEYKNLPILIFYAFALIMTTLRLIFLIWYWTFDPIIDNIDWVIQAAQLCVGVVHDWITLELAVRIHNAKGFSEISEEAKSKLRVIRCILFAFITLSFLAFTIAVVVTAHLEGNRGSAFYGNFCSKYKIIGYLFLTQVIVMSLLVIWLFVEAKKAVNRERRASVDGRVTQTLRRERCTYAIITVFFGLSYIGRTIDIENGTCGDEMALAEKFGYETAWASVFLLEGVSMGVLMGFHYVNFRSGSLLAKDLAPKYASIKMGEYHFFRDSEVDAHSLADRSTVEQVTTETSRGTEKLVGSAPDR